MKILYPILNISFPLWEEELIQEFIREDDTFYSSNTKLFNQYFLNQTFVDCRGSLFKVTASIDFKIKYLLIFKRKRKRLVLESTHASISFNDLKEMLNQRSMTLKNENVKSEFRKLLNGVNSIEQLLKSF